MIEEKNYKMFRFNELTEKDIIKRLQKIKEDWYKLYIYFPKKISGYGNTKKEVAKNFFEEIKKKQQFAMILEDKGGV